MISGICLCFLIASVLNRFYKTKGPVVLWAANCMGKEDGLFVISRWSWLVTEHESEIRLYGSQTIDYWPV